MTRIFSCLAVISLLVIAMATDVPTPILATKIRDSINYQIRKELSSPSSLSVKISLRGFPHQTGESVTNLRCIDSLCHGLSNIAIAGIGEGHLSVDAITTFIQWSPRLSFFAFKLQLVVCLAKPVSPRPSLKDNLCLSLVQCL
jgi:hypothetical protein